MSGAIMTAMAANEWHEANISALSAEGSAETHPPNAHVACFGGTRCLPSCPEELGKLPRRKLCSKTASY